MNQEPDLNSGLQQQDLFELFRRQLAKDFESSGLDAGFAENLPSGYEALKAIILLQVEKLIVSGSPYFAGLLYRIDISEHQLSSYGSRHQDKNLAEVVAELIIRRTLQKVILKKRFSK